MKILTIIVTYNGNKWVDKCFTSLKQSSIPVDVIVLDNGSTDGTINNIKNNFPEVELIETGENLGFGKANNIGLKKVLDENYDYAFLLNQDAWVEPDTIGKLTQISLKHPEYGILSPIHLAGSGEAIDRIFQNYLGVNFVTHFLSDLYLGKQKEHYVTKYANAAAWLIPNKTLKTIGLFDLMFSHYGEDDDFVIRLHQAGLRLGLVPNSRIYHDRPQQTTRSDLFYKNEISVLALKQAKHKNIAKHFLYRRIVAQYFTLYFTSFGRNKSIRRKIKIDKETLVFLKPLGKG
ncbi:glycosyltransferase family 2 protein [Tamlana sp. 2_MG-2023]|uniref:glycosyltransferase family 2 protein n=1 Tax=unclassified Tamlana TaxID=2614803 RepID=UPI0026E2F8BE|nr:MULTISPECIES: glycosyltransferase family 2 protein [unclassified Tamlana]MDO6760239.1 glycosyltransferase family 2 protein [Tamlana sp. 2_MG-2023]MDO6790063.1 glycosyltransferase family 2 protein [Tamlana sp. 1_MG-2023]